MSGMAGESTASDVQEQMLADVQALCAPQQDDSAGVQHEPWEKRRTATEAAIVMRNILFLME